MSEKPLQMPDLSKLSDPTKDLFGGTNPTDLMSMSSKQTDDVLSPAKIDVPWIKLSDEASKSLQRAQDTQKEIISTTAKMQNDLEREYAAQEKELKKRREEKKKQQGGLLGAGTDGSFILKSKAEELINNPEWKGIVSDMQRRDLTDQWIARAAEELRKAGVTDESTLANEIKVAKNVIDGDTKAYTAKMKSDAIDPLDVVSSTGKAARNLYMGTGILFNAAQNISTDLLRKSGVVSEEYAKEDIKNRNKKTAEFVKNQQDAINTINNTYSDTMLLDQANYQYLRSKSKKNNPKEGVIGGFTQGAKDLWDSGNVLSLVVDTAGYVPYAVVGTTAVSSVLGGIGAATGVSAAVSGITGGAGNIGARVLGSILNAETVGASVASGVFAATDAAGGTYNDIIALDFKDPKVLNSVKDNYIKAYGSANWDSLMAENNGDVDAVKNELALQSARVAGSTAFVTTAPLGAFGLEASIAKIGAKGATAQAGKRMLTIGANSVSETLEEGFTQYAQNVGAHPVTGVDLSDDVGSAAAAGGIASVGMSSATQGVAKLADSKQVKSITAAKPTFDSNSLNTDKWASAGVINYEDYHKVIGHQFTNIAKDARKINLTDDDVQQLQQEAFNSYIDNNAIWSRLTPEQSLQLKDYLALSFNVNSNPYAKYTETPETKAWNSNNADEVASAILEDKSNMDLLQAYRVKNNVDLEQVPNNAIEYYKTLGDVLDSMKEFPTDVNTREREAQFQQIRADKVVTNQNLTELQKRGITMFMRNFTDAGSRRMTGEQVQAYNEAIQTGLQGGSYEQGNIATGKDTTTQTVRSVPQESTGVGTAVERSLSSPSQGLEQTNSGATGGYNAEVLGNGVARERVNSRYQTDNTKQYSGSIVGTSVESGQTPQIGIPSNTTASENAGGTAAQQGNIGRTQKSSEPIRRVVSGATETPVSSGIIGTTQTERNPNGGSQQATSETNPAVAPAIVPNISLNTAKQALDSLTPAQRKEIKRLSNGEDSASTLHNVLSGSQANLTSAINAATQNKVVANKIQNAVTAARDYALSASKLIADLNEEQIRNTANTELIDPISEALNLSTAKINSLASLASDMYLEKATTLEDKKKLAAKLLADFAGVPKDLTYTLLVGKLDGTGRAPKGAIATLINSTLDTLRNTVIPGNVESRPSPLEQQVNMLGITSTLANVDTSAHNKLNSATKRIVGRGGEANVATLLQSLIQMKKSGVDVGSYLQIRLKNKQITSAVIDVVTRSENYINSSEFSKIKGADTWLQNAPVDTYLSTVSKIIAGMAEDANSTFNKVKKNIYSVSEHVTGGVVDTPNGINYAVVDSFIANTISDMAKLGDQYLQAIIKTRGGINNKGDNRVSTTAANNVAKVITEAKNELLRSYVNGDIESVNTSGTADTELRNKVNDEVSTTNELNINSDDKQRGAQPTYESNAVVTDTTESTSSNTNTNPEISNINNVINTEHVGVDEHVDRVGEDNNDIQNGNDIVTEEVNPNTTTNIPAAAEEVTVYPKRVTQEERSILKEMADDFGVKVNDLLHAIVNKDNSFLGVPIEKEASLYLYDSSSKVDKLHDFINRVTSPYTENSKPVSGDARVNEFFKTEPEALKDINDWLTSERTRLNNIIESTLSEYADKSINSNDIQARKDKAIRELRELPKDTNEFVSQYIVDNEMFADREQKLSIPQRIKDIIDRIFQQIGKTVAGISMAIGLATGVNVAIPNQAMAATAYERNTVSHIVSTADNNGKPIIVADKKGGTLTIYDNKGNQITSTSALFGKTKGDLITQKNTTPSGRFELTEATNKVSPAYGNSAQMLSKGGVIQRNNAGALTIHRVLTSFKSENRQGRLDSKTAADNRISHGCINVPVEFYDKYLDGKSDAVVYILPETDIGKTGVFSDNINVNGTTVEPAMNNANATSVVVNHDQLKSALPLSEVKESPIKAMQPLVIADTKPTTQVALTTPIVIGGVTADQVTVPFDVHTPAELRTDGIFDTQPISSKDKTDDGHSVYDIAVALAGLGIGVRTLSKRRKNKLTSKKNKILEDSVTQENTDQAAIAQEEVDINHNDLVNPKAKHVIKNVEAPVQKTPLADAISRSMWMNYIQDSHLTVQKDASGNMVENGQILSTFYDTMMGFEWAIDDVLSDKTYEDANSGIFSDPLKWNNKINDSARVGTSAKVMNFVAGVTQTFDNLMTQEGIARIGYERDSSIPSKNLAAVKSKSSGAYSQIHKMYIKPMVTSTDVLSASLRRGYEEVEADVGRVATVNHILNEAAEAMFKGRERIIEGRKEQLAAVNANLAATPADATIRLTLTNVANELTKDIRNLTNELSTARDMYNGVIEWDGKVGMPGGYTKAAAEATLSDLRSKYGENFNKIEDNAKELVSTIRSIRDFAAASGVFSNSDLKTFKDLGFTEYVPLFKEHQDPRVVDEASMATKSSVLDVVLTSLPTPQVRAMGLNKDFSQYRREGATSYAADAYTNMKVFANNLSGRIGSVGWINSVQQLYEGTVGKPISATQLTDENYLNEINASYDSGKLPGLIRVRPGMEQYLPANIATLIKDIRAINGKGYNNYGELVPYNYYFTEPAIQAEIYANTDLTQTLPSSLLRNIGSMTRLAARMITTFKPVWNIYNFLRDSSDRVFISVMRPVKDSSGKLVGRMDIAKSYFRNLAKLSGSLEAQQEIYRYLTLGETSTQIQKIMNEAVGEGAINLMTSQTEKNSITADYRKSTIDRVSSSLSKQLGAGLNKLGLGALKHNSEKITDFYVMRLTEVPQIITALASYMSYKDLGVNKAEAVNRVRDQYDPTRASGKFLNSMSQAFPFVRSTFSGHYNLARSLTEYWTPGQWQYTLALNLGGVAASMAVMAMVSSLFGDDDDGTPKLARLPVGTLTNGIPIPVGENGVWSLPVGFGHSKVLWGIGASLYKYVNGQQSGAETAQSLLGIVVDNTSPLQTASGNTFQDNPTVGLLLSVTPLFALPIMENATNTKSFGGGKIITRETPRDQLASEQDSLNTPETYKKWAKWLYSAGLGDHRPEEIRHLFEGYMWGPMGAIPKSVIQDISDKSLGNTQRKGEVFGPLLTAIGADMSIQTNALDMANMTYEMRNLRMKLHKKYGVGETHSPEDYESYGITGNENRSLRLTEAKLRERNVPEEVIQYILSGMEYDKKQQRMHSESQKSAMKYFKLRESGEDDPILRQSVQESYDNMDAMTKAYVKENSHAYFDLLRQ